MKRLQLALTDEARILVESLTEEANNGFDVGSISYSDVVSELIVTGKLDINVLRSKHTDIPRSLRKMASKADMDLDSAIKQLMELKSRTGGKRAIKVAANQEEAS